MDMTNRLGLPYLAAAQSQKHVTHNEALRSLDALVQLAVKDRTLTAPPASPVDGERHIIAASATGAWAGRSGQIAAFQDGLWVYYAPRAGWLVWVEAEGQLCVWFASGASPEWRPLAVDLSGAGGVGLVPGMIIGHATAMNATAAMISTVMTLGSSASSSTEGVQILTASLTPKRSNSLIRCQVNIPYFGPGSSHLAAAALFVNSETAARASTYLTTNALMNGAFGYVYAPGSLSPQTVTVRVGVYDSSYPLAVNGYPGVWTQGGTVRSILSLDEICQ